MARSVAVFISLVFLLVATTPKVFAISDEEVFRNFHFSFVNPGARSTAMGGAFIGLADDATAAEANPAGLTTLTKPEVSFEYRHITTDDKAFDTSAFLPALIPNPREDVAVATDYQAQDLDRLSFLSVVFPAGSQTFAFSRQESVTVNSNVASAVVFSTTDPNGLSFTLPFTASQDLQVVNYNFSAARSFGSSFSLGASVRYSHLDWKTATQNFFTIGDLVLPSFNTSIDATDNAFSWNIGGIGKFGPHFSVGAIYKKNPKFSVTENVVALSPIAPAISDFQNVLKIPDSFGAGVAIKPNDNITMTADIVHIEYSDLETDFQAGLSPLAAFLTLKETDVTYKVDNAYEYHVGGEATAFIGSVPVAVRIGYYRKPSASLLVASSPGLNAAGRQLFDVLYPNIKDENHFTFGSGVVFGSHFQLDWAADVSNQTDNFVLSTVIRF